MSDIAKKLVAGAVSGFATALVVDLNAWSKSPTGTKFDWALAIKRWVAGLVAGATAALGMGQVI